MPGKEVVQRVFATAKAGLDIRRFKARDPAVKAFRRGHLPRRRAAERK